jgi:alpha-glucosidase
MRTLKYFFLVSFITFQSPASAHDDEPFILRSPDRVIEVHISVDSTISWMMSHENDIVIAPSTISMKLYDGTHLGKDAVLVKSVTETVNETFATPIYRKNLVVDRYNQLVLHFEDNFGLIFRAYNDGVAYRFFTAIDEPITVEWEYADLNFTEDFHAFIPYVESREQDAYASSFESHYSYIRLSEFDDSRFAFTPILVELNGGKKAAILEADLEDYPGRFLRINEKSRQGFISDYARYPLEEEQGGHNNLQAFVTKRADYIAKTDGNRTFPWRAVVVSTHDKQLLDNDMVYKLASPSRVVDISWIKPGQLAWDWWNDWNISGVDFRAGINTQTYKYYIDFASEYGIEYILLDEGWSDGINLMKTIPDINLEEIIAHATERNVGVILWAGWLPLDRDMDNVFMHYAAMGIKGFKIDFMDRDDQRVVNFYYRAARKAAENKLLVDFHGSYKPTGLQRTYPNAITFEGVLGLEYHKWEENTDMPRNNVSIPFIRMMAGPMDYTPGAMRNANRYNFRAIHSMPMSQGTRCHQLAMYIVYDSPLVMLADNPTAFKREQESVDFITRVPTVFDRTVPLDGKVGEYVALARQKEDSWYVGVMTNWDPRQITLDFSFLPEGEYHAVIFMDGVNAHRDATDYRRIERTITHLDRLTVSLSTGGGWAARLDRK